MSIKAEDLIVKCQRNIPDIGSRVESADWYYYFTEAIRDLRAGRTMPWQRRTTQMEFFTNIFQYPLPADFDSFIKPHKDMLSATQDQNWILYGRDKDFFHNPNNGLALTWERAVRTLLARQDANTHLLVDSFQESDLSGYAGSGDIATSGLIQDTVYFKEGASSLRFSFTGSTGNGVITKTLAETIDISGLVNDGYVILWVYLPLATTSVAIAYGEGSDYHQVTATTDMFGNAFSVGWNLIKVKMSTTVDSGTVDDTVIDNYFITISATGASSDFRLGSLSFQVPSLMQLPYNSKNVVYDASNVYKETVTEGSDTILCDETFESVIMWHAIQNASMLKIRDEDLTVMAGSKFKDKMTDFNRRYPSTEAPLQSNYYSKFKSI